MPPRPGIISSVSEVAFWVTNVEAAVKFYTENLGFEAVDHDPGHNAFLQSGDFLLVLFNRESPNTTLGNDYLARTGGPQGDVYHVAFKVDRSEIDGLGESLRERGLEVKGPIDFAGGRRSYFLEDLDQHYLEITDR